MRGFCSIVRHLTQASEGDFSDLSAFTCETGNHNKSKTLTKAIVMSVKNETNIKDTYNTT